MLTDADFVRAADRLGCKAFQIRAVDIVESGGGWFTDVRASILALDGPGGFLDGPGLPKILFEAHIFSRETGGRYDLSHPHLSSPSWNRSLYIGGEREYERLYAAMQLDETAALRSASWARYQIMGFNHKLAGYPDVQGFVEAMKDSEAAHLQAFVSFVSATGLRSAMQAVSGDPETCRAFARGYNGSAYAANDYHVKIAAAYRKLAGGEEAAPAIRPQLRLGSSGPAVVTLQSALNRLQPDRKPLIVDGDFGERTEVALLAWQGANNLKADGIAGASTWASLDAAAVDPPDIPGEPEPLPFAAPEPTQPAAPAAGFSLSWLWSWFR